jgi:hypothetical protein
MPLTLRATHPGDFPQCLEITHDRFLFETQKSRAELFNFWGKILAGRLAMSQVVVDSGRPKGKNIVGFGMSFFATRDFAREARTTLPPFLSQQVLRRWKKGKRHSPFLDPQEVARFNAHGGLSVVTLHYGVEPRKFFLLELPARLKMFDGWKSLYSGFRIFEYLHEVYGQGEKKNMLSTGCVVRRDYAEALNLSPLVRDTRPFLTGIDAGEAVKKPSVPISFFIFSPPRFGFSQGEQDVLEKALGGEIDRDIAPALRLTVWAVDKRWQRIYAKVEKVEPSILGPAGKKNDMEYQKTRRRFLLDYLRDHMEEMRPYAPDRPTGKKKRGKP